MRQVFKSKPSEITVKNLEKNNENGVPFISKKRKEPKNIILIILEGFSQYHIEANYLPHLKSLQDESFVLNQFVAHQKQTNRGLFSILCGMLPNQKEFEAKSDLIVSQLLKPKCLPTYLKEFGYKNTFLQSAPLTFMAKDRFAKNIGFDYAIGAHSFGKERLISSWGVADEDIFSASLKLLEDRTKKQFLTLLTANTHHPYITSKGQMTFKQAISHIDGVVKSFIQEIKKRNLFKDSLILITSDEAFQPDKGLPLHYDNWGIFMALSEDLPTIKKDQVFGQKHIMDSVLHFLNKRRKDEERSIFNDYKTKEGIVFSNIFQKRSFYFFPQNRLLICNFLDNCILKRTDRNLFSYFSNSIEDQVPLKSSLKKVIGYSDKSLRESKVILSLNSISLKSKETKTLVSEYKFHSKKKRILINSIQTIRPKASAYICGSPNSKMDWTLKEGFFELPEDHKGKDLCLTLGVKNNSSTPVKVERLELSFE
ncbi:MAG: LTA synthase family protein [Halobacteriovoraceae bacterium]|nr:LTA synthase family protein [Halobacteriovoraceae bacterium]